MIEIVLQQLIFGVLVSANGVCLLTLLRTAPDRFRLLICIVTMIATFLPFPLLFVSTGYEPATVETFAPANFQGAIFSKLVELPDGFQPGLSGWLFAMMLGISAYLIAAVLLTSRRELQVFWQSSQASPNVLSLAHYDLLVTSTRVQCRTIRGSHLVATSGYFKPVVWVGDQIREVELLRSAINHELQHVQNGDQFLLLIVVMIERLFWWNPLMWRLGSRAREAMEGSCDRRVAACLGQRSYRAALARLMLLEQSSAPALKLNMLDHKTRIYRMERIMQIPKFEPAHIPALLAASLLFTACGAVSAETADAAKTVDSCHALLPETGQYELSITSSVQARSGKLSVSFVDQGDAEWDTPPDEVRPFLECIRQVVGVGEDEGWPGT